MVIQYIGLQLSGDVLDRATRLRRLCRLTYSHRTTRQTATTTGDSIDLSNAHRWACQKGNGVTEGESISGIESNYDYNIATLISGNSSLLFAPIME